MEKIFVNRDICDGCDNCVNMCASIHPAPRIKIVEHDSAYYSLVCQHCDNAPCVKICPTDAMTREGVKPEDCIGCDLCSIICPFGAITIADNIAEKCNLCADRKEGPACVKACTKRAISVINPVKVKIKNQEKYLSKIAGAYDIGSGPEHGFVHFVTSSARTRSILDE